MLVPMTSLQRAKNGDWFGRKAIPGDVRDAYKRVHGIAREERFRRPGTLPSDQAKQQFREWDSAISGRIAAFRTAAKGEGRSLTQREAHGLAGEWYIWFVDRYEDDPGESHHWDLIYDQLDAVYARFAPDDADHPDSDPRWMELPALRRHVHAHLVERGQMETFLAEREIKLTDDARELFLEKVESEYVAALALLKRRTSGDYGVDPRPQRFPVISADSLLKLAGVTCWQVFEAWVKERRPAPATINRWRSVFLALEKVFPDRDIASISNKDAISWKGTLVTANRSPEVANDVWLRAASTVFEWAKANKIIDANPFEDVSIAVPRKLQELRSREFNEGEWKTILRASLDAPTARTSRFQVAARRWVPWLCAYTGSRPGEVTQVRKEDFLQHKAGFWTMHITPEAGAVKGRKARTVPLHTDLIDQGFIDFVQSAGLGPLFYNGAKKRRESTDPTRPVRAPWISVRQKIGDWVRSLGVDDKNISPNHAWRHTFKRRAARAGIERRVRDAMCGHAPGTVGDKYETPSLEDLVLEMRKFPQYVLDVDDGTPDATRAE